MSNKISTEKIERSIFLLRGQKVLLDSDIAELYDITTGNLNKAVSRNLDRFPDDFMFRLTKDELKNLMFHFGISRWGGQRKLPRAFTEQGVAMLSSVLRSKRAVYVNILIMRVFVNLRGIISRNKEIAHKLSELEKKTAMHDEEIKSMFKAIRQMMSPELPEKRHRIGFLST